MKVLTSTLLVAAAGAAFALSGGFARPPGEAVTDPAALALRAGSCYNLATVGCATVGKCSATNYLRVEREGSRGRSTGSVYCGTADGLNCNQYAANRANCILEYEEFAELEQERLLDLP